MHISGTGRPDNTGGKQRKSETGTPVAIIDITSSGATSDGKPALTWGGARNRGDRTSEGLTLKQANGIIEAAQFAGAIGLPLNRHMTVHWEHAGVTDSRAAKAIGAFLTLARDWLRKQGERFASIWVRENGDGKGSHAHILMHVRPEMARAFTGNQRRWIRHVSGNPYRAGTIHTARIGGTLRAASSAPDHYAANLWAVVSYIAKSAAPAAIALLSLTKPHEPGGQVIGKRCGWSQNIGRKARPAAIK